MHQVSRAEDPLGLARSAIWFTDVTKARAFTRGVGEHARQGMTSWRVPRGDRWWNRGRGEIVGPPQSAGGRRHGVAAGRRDPRAALTRRPRPPGVEAGIRTSSYATRGARWRGRIRVVPGGSTGGGMPCLMGGHPLGRSRRGITRLSPEMVEVALGRLADRKPHQPSGRLCPCDAPTACASCDPRR